MIYICSLTEISNQQKFLLLINRFLIYITCLALLLISQVSSFAYAATHEVKRYSNLVLPDTQVRYIKSKINNISYKLYINLPANYYTSNTKYPVIFLLDADYSFPIAKQIVEHLSDRDRIQDILIVGIAYDGPLEYKMNRTRDYTPVHIKDGGYGPEYQKASGGAKKFAGFIRSELIPYIDKNFHVNKNRTLVGHSFGGLFATWLSFYAPNIFSNYIIVSPSLWYDKHYMFSLQRKTNSHHTKSHNKLFFGIGNKENGGMYKMVTDLRQFVENQKTQDKKDLKFIIFPYQDHDTIFPTALSQGLMFIYQVK